MGIGATGDSPDSTPRNQQGVLRAPRLRITTPAQNSMPGAAMVRHGNRGPVLGERLARLHFWIAENGKVVHRAFRCGGRQMSSTVSCWARMMLRILTSASNRGPCCRLNISSSRAAISRWRSTIRALISAIVRGLAGLTHPRGIASLLMSGDRHWLMFGEDSPRSAILTLSQPKTHATGPLERTAALR